LRFEVLLEGHRLASRPRGHAAASLATQVAPCQGAGGDGSLVAVKRSVMLVFGSRVLPRRVAHEGSKRATRIIRPKRPSPHDGHDARTLVPRFEAMNVALTGGQMSPHATVPFSMAIWWEGTFGLSWTTW